MSDKHPFVYRKADEEQSARIRRIFGVMADTYDTLLAELAPGRHRSLAITKLEECAMWAAKSVAFDPNPEEKTE